MVNTRTPGTSSGLSFVLQIILLTVVIVVLAYVLQLSTRTIQPLGRTHAEASAAAAEQLLKFSSPVRFEPFPTKVTIENKHPCNANSLHPCDMNDVTTLFGCAELAVKCHHFDVDTKYMHENQTTIIPRNSSPNEGYALAIPTVSEACNPYHGDMTLVTANATSTEYMLVCICKNPGYIGNETLLGDCTTPFICGGQIVSLEKTLNEIECRCASDEINIRYEDGLPVCKKMLVHEANERYDDWSHLVPWSSSRTIDTSVYNPTIAGNIRSSKLLNPCTSSLHDPRIEIPYARYDSVRGECIVAGHGMPLPHDTVGMLRVRIAESGLKPIAGEPEPTPISAVLATSSYKRIRVSGSIGKTKRVLGLVVWGIGFGPPNRPELATTETALVIAPDISFSGIRGSGAFTLQPKLHSFWGPQCKTEGLYYYCSVRENCDRDVQGLPLPAYSSPPWYIWWSKERWIETEKTPSNSFSVGTFGIRVSATAFLVDPYLHGYGLQWSQRDDIEPSGVLTFLDERDYKMHTQILSQD